MSCFFSPQIANLRRLGDKELLIKKIKSQLLTELFLVDYRNFEKTRLFNNLLQ
ncbi:hypothetical protein GM3709_1710 [Geminocystis sp. NIES-3709]|nr:hypothetical protein GM3709_1710 [Geminocystis sp. NIES-3709]